MNELVRARRLARFAWTIAVGEANMCLSSSAQLAAYQGVHPAAQLLAKAKAVASMAKRTFFAVISKRRLRSPRNTIRHFCFC